MAKLSLFFFLSCLIFSSSFAFQSDELLVDDDEFGLEGGKPRSTDLYTSSPSSSSPQQQQQTPTIRRRYSDPTDLDSKVQFTLEHAFGDSDFSPAGTFSARLKTWSHGGKVLFEILFIDVRILDLIYSCYFDLIQFNLQILGIDLLCSELIYSLLQAIWRYSLIKIVNYLIFQLSSSNSLIN